MILELPPYRLPRIKDVALHMVERAWIFLRNAGTVILAISVRPLVSGRLSPRARRSDAQQALAQKLCRAGRPHPRARDQARSVRLADRDRAHQLLCRPGSLRQLDRGSSSASIKPAPTRKATSPPYAQRCARPLARRRVLFTPLVCLSLMLFYVFAMQCMSTVAVVRRETNFLAMAALPDRLHDRHALGGLVYRLPSRPRAGIWVGIASAAIRAISTVSPVLQTIAALLLVGHRRRSPDLGAVAKRGKPGCGSGCGCPTDEFKQTLKK